MHKVNYEFLMKPEESVGCHQTLSSQVRGGSGHETNCTLHSVLYVHTIQDSCLQWFSRQLGITAAFGTKCLLESSLLNGTVSGTGVSCLSSWVAYCVSVHKSNGVYLPLLQNVLVVEVCLTVMKIS